MAVVIERSFVMGFMNRVLKLGLVSLLGVILAVAPSATSYALTTPPPLAVPTELVLAEIKITGDEFLIIQNNSGTNIADLSQYWLEGFNNVNPLAAGVSSSTQQLPAVNLAAGQSVMLSAVARPTCAVAVAGKLNLSLSDSGGFLEIVQLTPVASGAVSHLPGDAVSWSSSTSGQIAQVPSSTKDPQGMYYRYQMATNSFGWQLADQDTANPCQLNVVITSGGTTLKQSPSLDGLLSANDSAPSRIVSLATDDIIASSPLGSNLPQADEGLIIPEITELLPNPSSSGNDTVAEYIELYNPNDQPFDLSSFSLRSGTTVLHSYTFPPGTSLPGQAFSAYYAVVTGLSLSNSGGRVGLLDPLGNELISSATYGSAKDDQAWALANGNWYWTISPTPGAPNVIIQPMATTANSLVTTTSQPAVSKTTKAKSATTPKAAKAPKAATTKSTKAAKPKTVLAASSAAVALPQRPIHASVLALVAGLALLYGAYEYRTDLSNQLFKLRRQFTNRR